MTALAIRMFLFFKRPSNYYFKLHAQVMLMHVVDMEEMITVMIKMVD